MKLFFQDTTSQQKGMVDKLVTQILSDNQDLLEDFVEEESK